jgi:hypothetical protein
VRIVINVRFAATYLETRWYFATTSYRARHVLISRQFNIRRCNIYNISKRKSRVMRFNKVPFPSAKIAMQLRSPRVRFVPVKQACLPCIFLVDYNETCWTSTRPYRTRPPSVRRRTRRWPKNEYRVPYYIWPAQIRHSTVILIRALGVIHDGLYEYSPSRREDAWSTTMLWLVERARPRLITFIERKQFRDLRRLLNPANCDGHVAQWCSCKSVFIALLSVLDLVRVFAFLRHPEKNVTLPIASFLRYIVHVICNIDGVLIWTGRVSTHN